MVASAAAAAAYLFFCTGLPRVAPTIFCTGVPQWSKVTRAVFLADGGGADVISTHDESPQRAPATRGTVDQREPTFTVNFNIYSNCEQEGTNH